MRYEPVIGLELHIQLATASKLFSPSSAAFGAEPNTHVNEIDLAYPGVLPVLNAQAVHFATLFGLAIGAEINPHAIFMRKNYFYPDLPKGYQISQLDDAIIRGGKITVETANGTREVRINRGQLEEDAGKSVHDAFSDRTGIDLNRAGVPLIELVSEPDLRSATEAVAYMRQLHHLVRYLGISDGNMQEGSFRCDANVSIREQGSDVLNPRVELKNINSFRFVEQAINLEIERQSDIMESGGTVEQETRLFDPDRMETRTMRSKEEANEYRYFPDPDLLTVIVDDEMLAAAQQIPELPDQKKARYVRELGIKEKDAEIIISTYENARFFEDLIAAGHEPKLCVSWLTVELAGRLKNGVTIEDSPVNSAKMNELLSAIEGGAVSQKAAKEVLDYLMEHDEAVSSVIDKLGLRQVSDDGAILQIIARVMSENEDKVADYRGGKDKLFGFFVGQVMKEGKGAFNPAKVNELLKQKLG